jgi:hypothetical protein
MRMRPMDLCSTIARGRSQGRREQSSPPRRRGAEKKKEGKSKPEGAEGAEIGRKNWWHEEWYL